VKINVERNLYNPVFTSSGVMRVSIPEIVPAGTSVATVTANDRDTAVSIDIKHTAISRKVLN